MSSKIGFKHSKIGFKQVMQMYFFVPHLVIAMDLLNQINTIITYIRAIKAMIRDNQSDARLKDQKNYKLKIQLSFSVLSTTLASMYVSHTT